MKNPLIASGLLLLTAANTALAHPGHDHSDWSSPLVHTLFYGYLYHYSYKSLHPQHRFVASGCTK